MNEGKRQQKSITTYKRTAASKQAGMACKTGTPSSLHYKMENVRALSGTNSTSLNLMNHTSLLAMIMLTATAKLNDMATIGPHNLCCCLFAPSDVCISWYNNPLTSSRALPARVQGEKHKICVL